MRGNAANGDGEVVRLINTVVKRKRKIGNSDYKVPQGVTFHKFDRNVNERRVILRVDQVEITCYRGRKVLVFRGKDGEIWREGNGFLLRP